MEERHVPFTAADTDSCSDMCCTDPDLILLRKNAADERMAIYQYLCAAEKSGGSLSKLFLSIARDEMIHFRRLMSVAAIYDPIQSCTFDEVCVNLPPIDTYRKSKNCSTLEAIGLLSQGISHELHAINTYQQDYICAQHKDVKILLCETGADEKFHVAKLWKALLNYTVENTCIP